MHLKQKQLRAALLLTAGLALVTLLSPPQARAEKALAGEVCTERVHQLTTDIEWNKSLTKAEEDAKREGKLVFWVHMLGKIDGAT